MFTTIITDCKEENEKGRQIARYNSLGLGPTDLLGIGSDFSDDATLEGSANLIDILDASEGRKGVVVLNVAPRGNKKDGGNGTHFSYFYYRETLVISTVKGYCLSLVKKLGLVEKVNLVELKEVLDHVSQTGLLDKELAGYIVRSQFRSLDFVPRLAKWLTDKEEIPYTELELGGIEDPKNSIWCIDAFGNAKTTLFAGDLKLTPGQTYVTNFGEFKYYDRLKDVPFGETAIYQGSSGLGDKRFLELATQGIAGSAKEKLNLELGGNFTLSL